MIKFNYDRNKFYTWKFKCKIIYDDSSHIFMQCLMKCFSIICNILVHLFDKTKERKWRKRDQLPRSPFKLYISNLNALNVCDKRPTQAGIDVL